MIIFNKQKFKKDYSEKTGIFFKNLEQSGNALVITVIIAFALMLFFCCAVFFINVKGAEKVLVPEVRGKKLPEALIEMQEKELYPKITLRYSEASGDEGTILSQKPEAGSIVKGYSRVSLVVSRGFIVNSVENYKGMNIEDLRMKLQTLFAGSTKPLITLAEPIYKSDNSPAGTIIEQDPPENTDISQPVVLKLIISKGPGTSVTSVPYLKGKTISSLLKIISQTPLIFNFSFHPAYDGEIIGCASSQYPSGGEIKRNYSQVEVEIPFPEGKNTFSGYGIFSADLTEYPYPVPMRIEALSPEGINYTLINFFHIGGKVTIPYSVTEGTVLTLYAAGVKAKSIMVH